MQKQDHQIRKDDHININLTEDVKSKLSTGFEYLQFEHNALPEFAFDSIDIAQTLFGKTVKAPILISSMTGGVVQAEKINRNLASAAQLFGIAMGVGSQRPMLDTEISTASFDIRKYAPDILLFSNIGAVQLNYGVTISHLQHLVDSIDADALILHLNSMQEVFQPEGQLNFTNLLPKIEEVVKKMQVPVIVKEVGWGISGKLARQLEEIGVAAVDVAGAGGTSWSQIEKYRQDDPSLYAAAEAFRDWGNPTAVCLQEVKQQTSHIKVFSSGGLQNGVDAAKSIALGAVLCGFAGLILRAATQDLETLAQLIEQITLELKISMFGAGAKNLQELSKLPLRTK
jgi:isopentenyl-diphosphate Delta-isomerase